MEKEKAELEATVGIMERKLMVWPTKIFLKKCRLFFWILFQESEERVKEEEDAKNLMYAEYAELQRNFDHVKK